MRFRDRQHSDLSYEMEPESGEYGGGAKMYECAHAQSVCSDGRTRVVRQPEMEQEPTRISRPRPYPTGTRSEPGQHY